MTNDLKIKILHFLTEVQSLIKDEKLSKDLRDIRQEVIVCIPLDITRWFQIRDLLRVFCDDIVNSTFDRDERGRIAWTDGVLKSLGDKEEYNAPTDTTDVNIALNYIIRSLKEYNDKSVLTDYESLVEGLRSFVNAKIY